MKKIKLNASKLGVNKETMSSLTNEEMNSVKGGFTYALSLGWRCRYSNRVAETLNTEFSNYGDCIAGAIEGGQL